MKIRPLAEGVECNMVVLTPEAINAHYDGQHYKDRLSRTPLDQTFALIERERQMALAILAHEGRLRVYSYWDGWKLIKRGRYYEL